MDAQRIDAVPSEACVDARRDVEPLVREATILTGGSYSTVRAVGSVVGAQRLPLKARPVSGERPTAATWEMACTGGKQEGGTHGEGGYEVKLRYTQRLRCTAAKGDARSRDRRLTHPELNGHTKDANAEYEEGEGHDEEARLGLLAGSHGFRANNKMFRTLFRPLKLLV